MVSIIKTDSSNVVLLFVSLTSTLSFNLCASICKNYCIRKGLHKRKLVENNRTASPYD